MKPRSLDEIALKLNGISATVLIMSMMVMPKPAQHSDMPSSETMNLSFNGSCAALSRIADEIAELALKEKDG